MSNEESSDHAAGTIGKDKTEQSTTKLSCSVLPDLRVGNVILDNSRSGELKSKFKQITAMVYYKTV